MFKMYKNILKTFILEKQLSTIELFATDDLLVLKYLIELQLYDFFKLF